MSAASRRPTCENCHAPSKIWTRMRAGGRTVCSLKCATLLQHSERKASLDAMDLNPVVCRCDGAPTPLQSGGVHCGECRRMFSVEVRLWLRTDKARVSRMARVRLGYENAMRRVFALPHSRHRSRLI
jgi:hypothetical protein